MHGGWKKYILFYTGSGVAEKINQFCHMMEDGEFVYSREKGIDLIRKIINNCEESV